MNIQVGQKYFDHESECKFVIRSISEQHVTVDVEWPGDEPPFLLQIDRPAFELDVNEGMLELLV